MIIHQINYISPNKWEISEYSTGKVVFAGTCKECGEFIKRFQKENDKKKGKPKNDSLLRAINLKLNSIRDEPTQ